MVLFTSSVNVLKYSFSRLMLKNRIFLYFCTILLYLLPFNVLLLLCVCVCDLAPLMVICLAMLQTPYITRLYRFAVWMQNRTGPNRMQPRVSRKNQAKKERWKNEYSSRISAMIVCQAMIEKKLRMSRYVVSPSV